VGELSALTRREGNLAFVRGLDAILSDDTRLTALEDARAVAGWLAGEGQPVMRLMRATASKPCLADLARILDLQKALSEIPGVPKDDLAALGFFTGFAPHCHEALENFVRQYHAAKQPVVGYLFTRARARAIDEELGRQLPCRSALEAHKQVKTLVRAATVLSSLRSSFGKAGIAVEHHHWAYQQVIDKVAPMTDRVPEILKRVTRLQDALARDAELGGLGIEAEDLGWVDTACVEGSLFARLTDFAAEYRDMKERFSALPEFDYVGEKSRLESLHTQRLAHTIDERVVEFAYEHKNLAQSLRDIIRKRQRFPREAFEHLKQAFPCMIAGIRDYAEYVPLEQGLFDLVIIDEASQVSIAQAFPAFVRAKQLVVLGDKRQFSNVKTTTASREINTKYTHEIIDNFRRESALDANTLNRLQKFNIKVSVLEFIERIANYNALLKKHFRGYPELISFSSKTFYRGQLQAVKIRGKRIEDVICFSYLAHDGRVEPAKNVNSVEAEAILKELRDLAELDMPPSVGVITPHTEQQAFLVQLVSRQHDADRLNEAPI